MHCIPRHLYTDDEMLYKLEWFWGLTEETLNLDSSWNILTVGAFLHTMFDNNSWFLCPAPSLVQHFYNLLEDETIAKRENFIMPQQPAEGFEYTIIPLAPIMKHTIITRDSKGKVRASTSTAIKEDAEIFVYPFEGLTIRRHIRPHFVVYQAGLQIEAFFTFKAKMYEFLAQYPLAKQMYAIYDGWSQEVPENCYQLDSSFRNLFGNAPDPVGFNSAVNTRPKRIRRAIEADSPTMGKGKRLRAENPQ